MPIAKLSDNVLYINPMIKMADQMKLGATAAPNATARYLAYINKIGLPISSKMVADVQGKYVQPKIAEVSNTKVASFEEIIFDHVMSKVSSDEKTEDILKVFEVIGSGIEKLSENPANNFESPEFIEKIKSSIDDGSFFEILKKD